MPQKIITWKEVPKSIFTYTYNDFKWLADTDLLISPDTSEIGNSQVSSNQCVSLNSLYTSRDFDLSGINTKPESWTSLLRWTPRSYRIYSKELLPYYSQSEINQGIQISTSPNQSLSNQLVTTVEDLQFNYQAYTLHHIFVVPEIRIQIMQNAPNSNDRVIKHTTTLTDLHTWLQQKDCGIASMVWSGSYYTQYFSVNGASIDAASLPAISLDLGNINIGSTSFSDNVYINIQCTNANAAFSSASSGLSSYDGNSFHAGSVITNSPNFQTTSTAGSHTISFDVTLSQYIITSNLPGPAPINIEINGNLTGRLNVTFNVVRV